MTKNLMVKASVLMRTALEAFTAMALAPCMAESRMGFTSTPAR